MKMDRKAGTGELSCKVCGQKFQTGINYLSAGVDVYADWVDACDAVAKAAAGRDDNTHDLGGAAGGRRTLGQHLATTIEDDDDLGDYDDE